jgi:hypothetical protein
MRYLQILVLCVTGVGCLNASDDAIRSRDGNWWRQQTEARQHMYVVGFFDGMLLGRQFSWWGIPKDGEKLSLAAVQVHDSFSTYYDKYFKNPTNKQISDGLNNFYEDYRNRSISIDDAVWLVVRMIAGDSDETMKPIIEQFRKGAN